MGIKGKFLAVLVFTIIALQALMTYQIFSLNESSKEVSHNAEKDHKMVMGVSKIALLQKDQVRSWNDLLLRGSDKEKFNKYSGEMKEISEKIETSVNELKNDMSTNQVIFVDNFLNLHKELTNNYITARDQFLAGKEFQYQEADKALAGKDQAVFDGLAALSDLMEANMIQETEDSLGSAYSKSMYLFWFGLGLSVILLVFGNLISKKISDRLVSITESVGSAGEQVYSASEQLQGSSHKLSESAQNQASAIEETSASLTEISGMAEANSRGAEEANAATHEVFKISEGTRESMGQLTFAMDAILESNKKIEDLVKIIEEIGSKTELIDEIVFKTQLLSFNASVEAERAGEHGRGFSVVAQEVGNLAQTSGKAAQEISQIVKTAIKEATVAAAENKEKVSTGSELASETKIQMENVLKKLSDIQNGVEKIVSASREQGQGINQISNAMNDLSRVTQENASISEESASASSELDGQAGSLMQLVSEMHFVVTGKQGAGSQKVAGAKSASKVEEPVKQDESHFKKSA